jgi:hypothetical protein
VADPVQPDESMFLAAHRRAIKADACSNCATGHVPTRSEHGQWHHGTMGGRCLSEVVHEFEHRNGLPAA